MLFTNTDSLVSVYVDFYRDKDLFDFCDYPQDSKFLDFVNKKVIGKTKDEFNGKIIRQFVRWKSKMSSLIAADVEEILKAKGFSKNVVKNTRHKEFFDVLFNKKWWDIRRKGFNVNCKELDFIMFVKFLYFAFDDKRYILKDGINSLAYFHKNIKIQ